MCNEIGAAATCSLFVNKEEEEYNDFQAAQIQVDETQYIATESYTNEGFQPLKSEGMQNSD